MKTADVIQTMQQIAEKQIQCYKSDFYDYDRPRLIEERPRAFVWMVRESGTHLMTPRDPEQDKSIWRHCYDVFANANEHFYFCTMRPDGSGTVTRSRARCDAFATAQTR